MPDAAARLAPDARAFGGKAHGRMKLIEALRILQREQASHRTKSLNIAFVCGFEPLHLETLLRARLTVAYPEHQIHIRTGPVRRPLRQSRASRRRLSRSAGNRPGMAGSRSAPGNSQHGRLGSRDVRGRPGQYPNALRSPVHASGSYPGPADHRVPSNASAATYFLSRNHASRRSRIGVERRGGITGSETRQPLEHQGTESAMVEPNVAACRSPGCQI